RPVEDQHAAHPLGQALIHGSESKPPGRGSTVTATLSHEQQEERQTVAQSPFPPIADHAFLSNCHTGALIASDGSVDWLWQSVAAEIKADILAHGVSDRGVLRQHYNTDALDASVLLAAMFGFLPGTDERLIATVNAIADELTENGFVLRYKTDETDDGM